MGKPPQLWQNRNLKHALDDAAVLSLITTGEFKVDAHAGTVTTRKGRTLTPFVKDRHLFVRLHKDGKRRGIALGKLVWMFVTKMKVPKGFDIHHEDRDPANNAWENLICLHGMDHGKQHAADPPDPATAIPF